MANILLIETATKVCSVGLMNENGMLAIREDTSMEYSHSTQLTTFIEEVVKECGIDFSQLDAVGVSMGPGSYTGLRIGVSVAKGLCYAQDIPLIAVNTLLAMANVASASVEEDVDFYIPMIDARRMEVYNAIFDSQVSQCRETVAEIIDQSSFLETLDKGKTAFFGDGAAKCKDVIQHSNASFFDDILPSVNGLVKPVFQKYQNKQFENLAYFEPFYLKDFVAGKPKVKGL